MLSVSLDPDTASRPPLVGGLVQQAADSVDLLLRQRGLRTESTLHRPPLERDRLCR